MNNQSEAILTTDDLAQAGQAILSHLNLSTANLPDKHPTSLERANHRAIKNWLTKYRPKAKASNLERVQGLLESFHHLCTIAAWEKATQVLLLRINVVDRGSNNSQVDPLHLQIGRWGHYFTQTQMYTQLSGHCSPEAEMVCLNGLGLAYQSLGNYSRAIEYHSQHLDLATQLEDPIAEQNALCNLGNVYGAVEQYAAATTCYEAALSLARQVGDKPRLG